MSGHRGREDEQGDGGHVLRLPRSANTATGIPQAIWATAPTKITAPSPASLRWNDFWISGPRMPMPLPMVSVTMRRHREQDQRREAVLAQDAEQRRGLALARARA